MRDMRDNDDPVVWGRIAFPPPLTVRPPRHEPITMDVGALLTELGTISHAATAVAHHILDVIRATSELQVLVMCAEADWAACIDRATKLRDLAAGLPDDAAELAPLLTRAADICLSLHKPGVSIAPGETG